MEATVFGELARMVEGLNDGRRHNRLHPLVSVVSIAVLAVLSNCDSWAAVARFAEMERKWLELFVPLPHGIPSRQTFERVFAMLKPEQMEQCLGNWFAQMHQWSQGALKQVPAASATVRRPTSHGCDG